jgi:hypothetical protein
MPFVVPSQFLTTDDSLQFTWLTLAELNKEILPDFGTDKDEDMDMGDLVVHIPGLYTGPPPLAPLCSIPAVPLATILAQCIINSTDKLCFISKKIGFTICEWRLICVVLGAPTSLYPSCLKDGKYIVDFYTSHPSDSWLNAINQRFWLCYHSQEDLMGLYLSCNTHLIRPSNTSEASALRHKLLPFRQYANLTHSDTYIHGPFDFATIHGCKSCDRVSNANWTTLQSHMGMFHNSIPLVKVATYSVHIDACSHIIFNNSSLMGRVRLVVPLLNSSICYFSLTMNSSVIVCE